MVNARFKASFVYEYFYKNRISKQFFFNENTAPYKGRSRICEYIYKLNDNEHLKREDKRISFEKRIFKVRQIVHKMQL